MPSKSRDARAPLSVVILAAGQGKRMQSSCPRCCSRSPGSRCSRTCSSWRRSSSRPRSTWSTAMAASRCVGNLADRRAALVRMQSEQLGTGACAHAGDARDSRWAPGAGAVRRCAAAACGDAAGTDRRRAGATASALLTCAARADPTGYGRIVRDARGAAAPHRRGARGQRARAAHPRDQQRRAGRAGRDASSMAGTASSRAMRSASTT